MAALIGFRSPRGPRGRQPAGLEFASRGASRLRGVFSSFLSPPLLSLSLFNFFSSSPPPLLSFLFHPIRGHLALGHADKAFRKGVYTRGAKLQNEFRLHTVELHSFDPFPVLVSARVLQAALPRTFSSLRLATPPFLPFLPFVQRSADRYRVDEKANRGRRFIIQFINHNASFDSLDHSLLRWGGDRQRIRRKDEGICRIIEEELEEWKRYEITFQRFWLDIVNLIDRVKS